MRIGRRHGSARDRERGAVIVIVAVTMTVSIGAAAFAVDLGGAWASQRRLHTATDAAALAVANEYAANNDVSCINVADSFVDANDTEAEVTACEPHDNGGSGYVTVSAERPVDFHFAGVLGIDSTDVASSTTAAYGSPLAIIGLRPIAVCVYFPAIQEWLNEPDGPLGPSEPIRIPFTKEDLGCENAPGNWEWLDIDGGGGGANELAYDLRNGSEESVTIPGVIEPKTGRVSSVDDDLNYLFENEIEFPIPLFNLKEGTGNNTLYHAVGVATVKLVDWNVGGSQDDDFFEFIFTPKTIEGTCCSEGGLDTGTRVVNICAVDEDFDVSKC
jgi:hypothetical protein